ncbi:metallophosphoesterase [Rhodopseudomonas palustris BisB5]|uniref:Metallophosphoesterase n=1 Tax=Rhodopseudomonas palustris (strain BisB5) TaxID=316057 RepID=Q134W1_RHOPS|nr:metallophosphoesterase [Rhodopseudomonas palustris BisB5]
MKFVVLTDTHFVAAGRRIYGLDPAERLRAAIACINRDHPEIALVIVTGDLAHWGEDAAYEALAAVLGELRAPSLLLMGNHDNRDGFSRYFPGVARDAGGFFQTMQVFDAATIVTLDTLNEAAPNHEGLLCDARLDFLAHALSSAPTDRPLLLFQHHPPFDTGLRYMDTIRLANPEAEWDVIARTRRPDYLFMGHLHRPIAGGWRGIPFHIQRALAHQVAFDLVAEGHIPGSHEAPDYSHVSVEADRIVIHQRSFLYDGPLFSLHDKDALDRAAF